MEVLFDLQQELETLDLDSLNLIVPVGFELPILEASVVDGVKTILVKDRPRRVSGIGIDLKELPGLRAGDRITVTGRVPREVTPGNWGIALLKQESKNLVSEECQLTMQISPKSLFALSYLVSSTELDNMIMIQTTQWGSITPLMNFYVDGILISRGDICATEDLRTVVYSLQTDENVDSGDNSAGVFDTRFLVQSGDPKILTICDGEKSIYFDSRSKDCDGIDLKLENLDLLTGNKYQVTITGETDGEAPDDALITLQGLPGFSWRATQKMQSNGEFTLNYNLSYAEAAEWKAIRVTTNTQGAAVPFYIHGIEVKRLGLL